ncbi:hypothetical protein V8D89_009163 [Ganoderma adspersum]
MPLASQILLSTPKRPSILAAASVVLSTLFLVTWASYGKKSKDEHSALFGDAATSARRIRPCEARYDFDEYDVVIVGGGTAGCILASRLSEDPSIRVLLLEAGESSLKNPLAIIPAIGSGLFRSIHDWGVSTTPQPYANSRARYWPRAKLLGGCTTLNALVCHLGAPEDYDEWATLQKGQEGASQWAYRELHDYTLKFEAYQPHPEYPDVDATKRGSSGPMQTGLFNYTSEGTRRFIKACVNAGIRYMPDLNTPAGTMGASKVMTFITPSGRRVTTEYAYLTPAVLARPNLKVIIRAQTTRVLFETSGPAPRAVGVEFALPTGDKFRVRARKEVVLAAGSVHTPQLLMLSGVGPAEHLAAHNVPVVADLPGVGSHLMDHLVLDFFYLDKTKSSILALRGQTFFDRLVRAKAYLDYKLRVKGPFLSNLAEGMAFVRSTDPALFPRSRNPKDEIIDTTSGPGAPDLEVFFTPAAYLKQNAEKLRRDHYFGLHAVLLRPTSTGTIRLKSNNPNDPPVIDPRYLSTKNDIAIFKRATRLMTRLVKTEPLASMLHPAGDDDPILDHRFEELDDAAVEAEIRRKVETIYHPTSTARMAPKEDGGVVDPFLRVHGIPNLRIVDASILPNITSGPTVAPVIVVGEKGADIIKAALSKT